MSSPSLFSACAGGNQSDLDAALAALPPQSAVAALRNAQGWSPVHVAARYAHVGALQTLLAHDDIAGHHGAASVVDPRGNTAAWVAAYGGVDDATVYRALVAHGADLAARNKDKQTALFAAAAQGNAGAVAALMAAAPDEATRIRLLTTTDGWRFPLHAAAGARPAAAAAATVQRLLDCGADPGAQDGFGATALVAAAAAGRADVADSLLRAGSGGGVAAMPCRPLCRPTGGPTAFLTAFDAARALEAEGNSAGAEVVQVLRRHGLRTPPPPSDAEVAAAKAQGQQCPVQ